ncbi:MAG: hypothetical protein RLZZ618_765 [Pseudomonadota bacterium]|jgi:AcrR family transcriptional regulator
MSSADPKPPSRQRRKEARPQELLDAALALFVEKGFAATRSEEVASRAGVSKGTLYLYYPSKEELLKAVIEQNLSQLIAHGNDIAEGFEGSTADLLALLLRTWWERVGNTPAGGIHKVIMSEVGNFPEIAAFYNEQVIVPAHLLITSTLQRGVERGEFRPMPLDVITHVLISPILFMALHKHSFGACQVTGSEVNSEEMLTTHIDLALNGLRPRSDADGARPALATTGSRTAGSTTRKKKDLKP